MRTKSKKQEYSQGRVLATEEWEAPLLFADHLATGNPKGPAPGSLPLLRRFLDPMGAETKAAVLCVHGIASNRHVFDAGSGKGGRERYSFMEYLALCGYDVWSVDLRGTRSSLERGCPRPKGIREYAEKDVPSALALVQTVTGRARVLLVGHSMGAAVCCAVAGHSPQAVLGVVHLAGLYNLTVPLVARAQMAFENGLPPLVQQPLALAMRLGRRVLLGSLGRLVRRWDDREYVTNWLGQPDAGSVADVMHPLARASKAATAGPLPARALSAALVGAITHVRRVPVPMRALCDLFLLSQPLQRVLGVEQACVGLLAQLQAMAPWAPDSLEDPHRFLDLTVESPTLGLLADMLVWHGSLESHSLADLSDPVCRRANPLDLHMHAFEQHPDLPVFFVTANADRVISCSDSHAGYRRVSTRNKAMLEYVVNLAPSPPLLQCLPDSAVHLHADSVVLDDALTETAVAPAASWRSLVASLWPLSRRLEKTETTPRVASAPPSPLLVSSLPSTAATTPLADIRYTLPHYLEYGHCDILGGKHAEKVWAEVVRWMDHVTLAGAS